MHIIPPQYGQQSDAAEEERRQPRADTGQGRPCVWTGWYCLSLTTCERHCVTDIKIQMDFRWVAHSSWRQYKFPESQKRLKGINGLLKYCKAQFIISTERSDILVSAARRRRRRRPGL